MRRSFLALCCLLLFGCASRPITPPVVDPQQLPQIGGTISENLLLDGDYLLVADLQVPVDLALTVKAGSRIFIQPSDSTKIDPEFLSRETEILIRGHLFVEGRAERPVLFRPLGEDSQAVLWSGLQLVNAQPSSLQHLIVEQAEAGVLCLDSSPQINDLQVVRSRYGILLQQKSAPQIRASVIRDGEAGIFCWDESAPQLSQSQILDLQEEGLYLGRHCRGLFSGNLISGNDRGVILPAGTQFPDNNQVVGNRVDFVSFSPEAH